MWLLHILLKMITIYVETDTRIKLACQWSPLYKYQYFLPVLEVNWRGWPKPPAFPMSSSQEVGVDVK